MPKGVTMHDALFPSLDSLPTQTPPLLRVGGGFKTKEISIMTKKVVAKETGSELMLYDPDQDAVHILNASALLVYKLCSEGRTLMEIELEMRRRFAVSQDEEVMQGVRNCLAELRKKGLVADVEEDAPG
jgi:hypothetical protein